MAQISCPNCGADLTTPQSVRSAEYHFGHLEPNPAGTEAFVREQPDTVTLLCNACKRLLRTQPLS